MLHIVDSQKSPAMMAIATNHTSLTTRVKVSPRCSIRELLLVFDYETPDQVKRQINATFHRRASRLDPEDLPLEYLVSPGTFANVFIPTVEATFIRVHESLQVWLS